MRRTVVLVAALALALLALPRLARRAGPSSRAPSAATAAHELAVPREIERRVFRRDVERPIADLWDEAVQDVRDRLADEPSFRRYELCRQHPEARRVLGVTDCKELLDEAYYGLLSSSLYVRMDQDAYGLAHAHTRDPERVVAQLDSVLSTSTDELSRLVAAVALARLREFEHVTLSPAAYERLEARPDAETQHMLMRHQHVPLPESCGERVAALARAPERTARVRLAAMRALGYGREAPRLLSAVEQFRREGVTAEFAMELGEALGGCGLACAPAIEAWAMSDQAHERRAALEALHAMPPSDRAELERAVRDVVPEEEWSAVVALR